MRGSALDPGQAFATRGSPSSGVLDKDRLHAELADDLRRGVVLPSKAAALFDIDETRLRALSMDAYPLSLPEVAVAIATKQLMAALDRARGDGCVADALERFGRFSHNSHVVTLVARERAGARAGTSPAVR